MRITSIELAGAPTWASERTGQTGLPRAFARIGRKLGDEHITVELLAHGCERTHQVQADDADDQWSMAQILQHALDGHRGTNTDIEAYYRELRRFAD